VPEIYDLSLQSTKIVQEKYELGGEIKNNFTIEI
jgi:hypothetical protein